MYRSEDEKLTDTIMGEAVIAMLKSEKTITAHKLIERLQFMANATHDRRRKNICEQLINEMRHSLYERANKTVYEVRNIDNEQNFFIDEGSPDDHKKH